MRFMATFILDGRRLSRRELPALPMRGDHVQYRVGLDGSDFAVVSEIVWRLDEPQTESMDRKSRQHVDIYCDAPPPEPAG